jgi:hypothetical protein
MQKEDGAGRAIKCRRRVRRVHVHWNKTTKQQQREQFKTWFPQHLSLESQEQRRFQEPDVEG